MGGDEKSEDSTRPPDSPEAEPPAIPYATPLDYAKPTVGKGGTSVRARWALGCFGYTALSFAWLFGTAMAGSSVYGRSLPPGVVLGGWVAMTVGLLGLTLWLRIRFGYKGYGYGILTAIGSALLLLGGLILLIIATCGHSKW